MTIELTDLEYRRLLDLVYVGNWVLNSTRGADRITDYDYMDILAEELARRDLGIYGEPEDPAPLTARMEEYIQEFEANGLENVTVDI